MLKFLKNLFGGGEKAAVAEKISLSEAEGLLESQLQANIAALNKEVFGKFSEIKFLLKEVREDVDGWKHRNLEAEDGHKRLRKIVQTTKTNFETRLLALCDRLAPPASTAGMEEIRKYCLSSSIDLERDLAAFWKNIAITSTLMANETKEMGKKLDELNKIFLALRKTIQEKEAVTKIPFALELIKELQAKKERMGEAGQRITSLEGEVAALEKEVDREKELLQREEQGKEFKQLQALQQQEQDLAKAKQDIQKELTQVISAVDKPLSRLLKASQSNRMPLAPDEERIAQEYLNAPVNALKGDPKGEKLKKILVLLSQAIESGAISLKDKEKEKKLVAIEELKKFDFFEKAFWRLNELAVRERELNMEKEKSMVAARIEKIKSKIDGLEKNLQEIGNTLHETKAGQEKLESVFSMQKDDLEERIGAVKQNPIEIVLSS